MRSATRRRMGTRGWKHSCAAALSLWAITASTSQGSAAPVAALVDGTGHVTQSLTKVTPTNEESYGTLVHLTKVCKKAAARS
jgi:hypothetical protein